MIKAIVFLLSVAVLSAIGYSIYYFFGMHVAFTILFVYVVIFLQGQKNYTDSMFRLIEGELQSIISRTGR